MGQLVKGGEPVAGVTVGLVQEDRSAVRFTREFTIGTDEDGRFVIPAVTPDDAYFLYGKMEFLRDIGAVSARRVRVGKTETTLDVGTIEIEGGHRLTGRLVTAEGEPLAAGLRVLVSREDAWDTQVAEVADDGSFSVAGLPAERYAVVVRGRGVLASTANYSCDPNNPGSLVGRIDGDLTGLRIRVDFGPLSHERPSRESVQIFMERRNEAIRGVE
jgi:outer membrane usher protein FimD/PapC